MIATIELMNTTVTSHSYLSLIRRMLVIYVYILYFLQVSTLDWVRAEKTYNLCEVLFKLHKVGILCTIDAFI